jgi:hypothetical protein
MPWVDAIYDRTLLDIQSRTDKAFFDVVDWIRINGNTEYVRALVSVLRDLDIEYNVLTTPAVCSIPTAAEMNAFIENIEYIREVSGLPIASGIQELDHAYQDLTNAPVPDYEDVNAWEYNLQLLKDLTVAMSVYFVFCGVAQVGQTRFYQNRWRDKFLRDSSTPALFPRCGIAVTGNATERQNKFRRYD